MTKQKKSKEDIKQAQFKVCSKCKLINPIIPVILIGFINTIAECNPKNVAFYMDLYGGIVHKDKSHAIGLQIDDHNKWHPVCITVINPELFDRIKVGIYVKVTGFFYATHKVKRLDTGKVHICHIAKADSVELLTLGEK